MHLTTTRITSLPPDLGELLEEGEREGFRFLRRLEDEWQSGANRFGRDGEALFIARVDGRLVGICGINVDPYVGSDDIARLRHLYVAPDARRHGIGRTLARLAIESAARHRFRAVYLRSDTEAAARFYESLGFMPIDDGDATHALAL